MTAITASLAASHAAFRLHAANLPEKMASMTDCPCCGFFTLHPGGGLQVCPICYWQDDGQRSVDPETYHGGPNNLVSLAAARLEYKAIGSSDLIWIGEVRAPLSSERPESS